MPSACRDSAALGGRFAVAHLQAEQSSLRPWPSTQYPCKLVLHVLICHCLHRWHKGRDAVQTVCASDTPYACGITSKGKAALVQASLVLLAQKDLSDAYVTWCHGLSGTSVRYLPCESIRHTHNKLSCPVPFISFDSAAASLCCAEASALVREQKAITPAASMPTDFRPSNARGAPPVAGDRRQDRSRFFMEKGWDGFTDPNTNIKPGDWACAECNQHNFARNRACFKCGAPKM